MKKLNKKGFTIVELSIVIAVVAILSAVLIPTFSGVIKNAKNSAAIQEARNAYTQYSMACAEANNEPETTVVYAADNGKFVVIENGKLNETAFASEAEAIEELGYTLDDTTTTDDEGNYSAKAIPDTNFKAITAKN